MPRNSAFSDEARNRVGRTTTLIGNIEIGKRFPSAANLNNMPPRRFLAIRAFAEDSEPSTRMPMTQITVIAWRAPRGNYPAEVVTPLGDF